MQTNILPEYTRVQACIHYTLWTCLLQTYKHVHTYIPTHSHTTTTLRQHLHYTTHTTLHYTYYAYPHYTYEIWGLCQTRGGCVFEIGLQHNTAPHWTHQLVVKIE
eukprot:m.25393 g.25393  ORF g.25393 m.25393 type:complete len:105 (-) comp14986_c0_seq1:97-411(-)